MNHSRLLNILLTELVELCNLMQIELQVGHEVAFLADGHKKSSSKPEKSAVADLENAARFPTHTRTHILTFIYRFPVI